MQSPEITGKNFAKLKFIGFFSAAVILCVVIFSSFWGAVPSSIPQEAKERAVTERSDSGVNQLIRTAQVLNVRWVALEQLYNEQISALADPAKTGNTRIMEAEVSYAKVLDSVSATNAHTANVEKIDSVVNSYRVALQNRQTFNNNINEIVLKTIGKAGNLTSDRKSQDLKFSELQNDNKTKTDLITKLQQQVSSVSAKNNSLNSNELKLVQVQNDLKAKTDLIAKLQTQLATISARNTSLSSNDQKTKQLQADLQSKADMITKLQGQVNAASAKNLTVSTNDQKLKQAQADLQSKTEMIAKLQGQLKAAPVKTSVAVDEQKLRDLQKDLQSKNTTIAKLQNQLKSMPAKPDNDAAPLLKDGKKAADELEFLKWALRSEVSSNHALTASVNQLKQANAALTNQLKAK